MNKLNMATGGEGQQRPPDPPPKPETKSSPKKFKPKK